MSTIEEKTLQDFIEKGAALEHARWARWQAYLHRKCVEHENGKGEFVCFPAELFRRWERQINTPYEELTEQEKESDRREVREYLPFLTTLVAEQRAEAAREVKTLMDNVCTTGRNFAARCYECGEKHANGMSWEESYRIGALFGRCPKCVSKELSVTNALSRVEGEK